MLNIKRIFFGGAVLIGLISILNHSCSAKKTEQDKAPAYIVSRDTLVLILTDFQLIEAELVQARNEGKNVLNLRDHYYSAVFDKYKIDRTTLDKNLEYYKAKLESLESVYTDVVTRLSRMESEAN